MAGIDAPYRDPREELRRAVFGQRAAPVAAQPVPVAPIPVGEATEFRQPSLEKTPAQKLGGSPEFREAQRGIGSMPKPAESATPRSAVPFGATTVGSVVRGSLPGLAGTAIGSMQARADAPPQPVDRRITAQTGPGQIPFDPSQTGPAPVAPRRPLGFGEDNEVTRNIAAMVNAVPGGGAALGIGRISQALATGSNVGQQVVRGAQSAAGTQPAKGMVSTQTPRGDGRANGGDLPAPPQGIADFNDRRFDAARGMTPAETGVIRFDPTTRTYSGTDVKEGASIMGGRPGGRGTSRGSVTTLDTSEGYAQDLKQHASLRSERAEREAGFAGNSIGGGLSGITDRGASQPISTESRVRDLMRAGLSNRQALQAVNQERSAEAQTSAGERSAAVQARGQDIGAAQGQAQQRQQAGIARMQDQTQRDIAALNASQRTAAANQQPRFTAVNLPDTKDADGQVVSGGQAVRNNQTGQWEYPNGGRQQQQVTPRGEYDKLPKGSQYVGPDGKTYIKG